MSQEKDFSSRIRTPIGRKIEKVRKLRGFTQEEIGKKLGISKQAYSKVEQSDSIPQGRIEDIAAILGVTVDGLTSFQDDIILNNSNHFNEAVHNSTNNNGFEVVTNNTYQMDPKVLEAFNEIIKVQQEMILVLKQKFGIE
jgi:transcriptional regulator with XRE-family HTH domain